MNRTVGNPYTIRHESIDIKPEGIHFKFESTEIETNMIENVHGCSENTINANLFMKPIKAEDVIDIKEEIKEELDTSTINSEYPVGLVNMVETVEFKMEVDKEDLDIDPANDDNPYEEDNKGCENPTQYVCPFCSYYTFNKNTLTQHRQQLHKNISEDDYNKASLSSYQAIFEKHIKQDKTGSQVEYKTKIFQCKQCAFQTQFEKLYFMHMLVHVDRVFTCKICNYASSSKHSLDLHAFKHKKEFEHNTSIKGDELGNFRCSECSYQTFNASFIDEHLRLHKEAVRWVECPYCPYKTSYKHGLRYHARLHGDRDSQKTISDSQTTVSVCNYPMLKKYHPIRPRTLEAVKELPNRSKRKILLTKVLARQKSFLGSK